MDIMFSSRDKYDDRFEVIYEQGKLAIYKIIRDKETGVNYLYHAAGYGLSVTPLLDKDGKPVVTID